jgi:hypothetical protein
MENANTRYEGFTALHEGHILRWTKQLAMRGNARNLSPDGVCGRQKLIVTGEFRRFVKWRDRLFPGATFLGTDRHQKKVGGSLAVAEFLRSYEGAAFTSFELTKATGVGLNNLNRCLREPVVIEAMGSRLVEDPRQGSVTQSVRPLGAHRG